MLKGRLCAPTFFTLQKPHVITSHQTPPLTHIHGAQSVPLRDPSLSILYSDTPSEKPLYKSPASALWRRRRQTLCAVHARLCSSGFIHRVAFNNSCRWWSRKWREKDGKMFEVTPVAATMAMRGGGSLISELGGLLLRLCLFYRNYGWSLK